VADEIPIPNDDDLLAAARQGDAESLEALILRHQARVFRFGLKMCGDEEDARDVVQETLLAMARSFRDFRGDSSFSTWLYTIARSFCIKKRRRGKFAPAHEVSLDGPDGQQLQGLRDPTPSPEQAASGREIGAALSAAIDSLDPGQREVLLLRDVEGLSAPEVGTVLGLSVDAVKSRLHRARLAVRRFVAPMLSLPAEKASSPNGCPDVLTMFSKHLEGDITPEVCVQMEAHLEGCDGCRGACAFLRRAIDLCRATPAPVMPSTVTNSVREAIRSLLRQQTI
jgi:RNA polymerase sigma-70 factor (ECF subfamily)